MDTGSIGAERQRRLTRRAVEEAGLTVGQVWAHYFRLTGNAGEYEVDAYLNGILAFPAVHRDLVSHAVNELTERMPGVRRAPYSRTPGGEEAPKGQDGPNGS